MVPKIVCLDTSLNDDVNTLGIHTIHSKLTLIEVSRLQDHG